MGFVFGFFCGIVFVLMMFPLIIKWYINKKVSKLTEEIFTKGVFK